VKKIPARAVSVAVLLESFSSMYFVGLFLYYCSSSEF